MVSFCSNHRLFVRSWNEPPWPNQCLVSKSSSRLFAFQFKCKLPRFLFPLEWYNFVIKNECHRLVYSRQECRLYLFSLFSLNYILCTECKCTDHQADNVHEWTAPIWVYWLEVFFNENIAGFTLHFRINILTHHYCLPKLSFLPARHGLRIKHNSAWFVLDFIFVEWHIQRDTSTFMRSHSMIRIFVLLILEHVVENLFLFIHQIITWPL